MQGDDELSFYTCGMNRPCSNLFKCKSLQICIHTGDVCDNEKYCPLGNDEILYDIKEEMVFTFLPHVAYYIILTNIKSLKFVDGNLRAQVLKVSNNHLNQICDYVSKVNYTFRCLMESS